MNPGLVIGYHGCSLRTAEDVLSGKISHLRLSNSKHEWLGKGIYCWENSYHRAFEWAQQHIKKDEEPAVIGIIISPGECLDLTDSKHLDTLDKVAEALDMDLQSAGLSIPENKGLRHDFDCALINYYHMYRKDSELPPIDTIRAAFSEGERIAGGKCTFTRRQHIQWAIINPKNSIVGYFRPAEGICNENA
ncbi:MAG: hypothetical protein IJ993_09775 [Akkermansia sp.]|nr:hypothetical protein [Akkermansia sp.]